MDALAAQPYVCGQPDPLRAAQDSHRTAWGRKGKMGAWLELCARTDCDAGRARVRLEPGLDTLGCADCLRSSFFSWMLLLLPEACAIVGTEAGLEGTGSGSRVLFPLDLPRIKSRAALRDDHGRSIYRIILNGDQSLIRMVQGKHFHFRSQADLSCDIEEVAGVGASHVGHTAQLPLAPEQLVVIKLRNAIQVDGVDRNHPSFPQARKRRNHYVSAGRKGHGAIQLQGRLFGLTPDPGSS